MKNYVHARLGPEEYHLLKDLKKATGKTESALVRWGLRLMYEKTVKKRKSVLELAGDSVGKFSSGLGDLSTNKKYLEGFGR